MKFKTKWTTSIFITIGVCIAMLYDIFVVVFWDTRYSISTFMQTMGLRSPMMTLGIGFFLGHFFGDPPDKIPDQPV